MPVGLFLGDLQHVRAGQPVAVPDDFASAQGYRAFETILGFDTGPTAVPVPEVAIDHAEYGDIGFGAGR